MNAIEGRHITVVSMDESVRIHSLDFTVVHHPVEGSVVAVCRTQDGVRIDTFTPTPSETLVDAAERYVRLRLGSQVPSSGCCHACGTPLESVFPGRTSVSQYHNALEVTFSGGYGMFIDPFDGDQPTSAVVCHDCAHALCAAFPWVQQMLDPTWSHTHRD